MSNIHTFIPNVNVAEGALGAWKVSRFEVTEEDVQIAKFRNAFNPGRQELPPEEGVFTKLTYGGVLVMSDTLQEKQDHMEFVIRAKGDVLIAGLGLGMVANAVARKASVDSVTVIEKSEEVISLVKASLMPKIRVTHADIFAWKPKAGVKWNCAWFDIWDNLGEKNLDEMRVLRRKFCRRVKGILGCWGEDRIKSFLKRGGR